MSTSDAECCICDLTLTKSFANLPIICRFAVPAFTTFARGCGVWPLKKVYVVARRIRANSRNFNINCTFVASVFERKEKQNRSAPRSLQLQILTFYLRVVDYCPLKIFLCRPSRQIAIYNHRNIQCRQQ